MSHDLGPNGFMSLALTCLDTVFVSSIALCYSCTISRNHRENSRVQQYTQGRERVLRKREFDWELQSKYLNENKGRLTSSHEFPKGGSRHGNVSQVTYWTIKIELEGENKKTVEII
jgi:hypothetical protein